MLVAMTLLSAWLAYKFYREPITPANLNEIEALTTIDEDVWEVEWSPDRTWLALVSWEKPVEIREARTLLPLKTVGKDKKIIHFAFSPNPNVVAYSENGTTVEIVNSEAEQSILLQTGAKQPRIAFSPDGSLVATGGYENSAKLWRTTSGELIHTLDMGSVRGGLTVLFSPDGKTLAVGNRNSSTRLFDVETGALVQELNKRSSHGLAFHPTGETLAIGYVDGSLALWDVSTGAMKHEAYPGAEEIYRVDWSPNGELLASSGLNAEITIWNGNDLTPLHALESPEWVIGLKFSPDGSRLITAGGGRQPGSPREVRIWGVRPF